MRPYYADAYVTLWLGDCRELLSVVAPVGPVVSDPPYGCSLRNRDVDGHRRAAAYDIVGDDDGEAGRWVLQWAATRTVVYFASPWRPWPGEWRNLIVWDKGGAVGGGGDIATCLKRSWELVQVANNGPINGPRAESVWRFPIVPADTSTHIAAKPVGLMSRLIRTFTNPAETIIDPFAGSGSTLVAAKNLRRRAIGIEIDERHCATIAQRLSQEVLELGA